MAANGRSSQLCSIQSNKTVAGAIYAAICGTMPVTGVALSRHGAAGVAFVAAGMAWG